MAIHHVNVKPETTAVLLEAAEQARMTLLDFESWVLDEWALLDFESWVLDDRRGCTSSTSAGWQN